MKKADAQKSVAYEEYDKLQQLLDDRDHEINLLNEQMRTLGQRYDTELSKAQQYYEDFKKFEEEATKTKKSNHKLRAELQKVKDEKDEL